MIDFTSYNLVTKEEDDRAYQFQKSVLSDDALSDEEKVIKISILLEVYIMDPETPLKILYDFIQESDSLKVLILGAYWDLYWPIFEPNPFLCKLKQKFDEYDHETKAVIRLIEALEIFFRGGEKRAHMKKVKRLLQESISLCDHLFTPYYFMAIINSKKVDKNWIIKGLSKIEKLISHDEYLKMDMREEISYEWYYKNYITRTIQTRDEVYSYAEKWD